MSGLPPRVVIVHRRTEFTALLARHGTRGQAAFFLASRGRDLAEVEARHDRVEAALAHIWGYTVGLDMTRRDLQAALKSKGHPWEAAKAFDHSAPVAPLVPVEDCGHPAAAPIWLTVNGEARQHGDLADMIWSVAEIIARLSAYFRLEPGDLIFTGTPEGVGPVKPGDVLEAAVDGLASLTLRIVQAGEVA